MSRCTKGYPPGSLVAAIRSDLIEEHRGDRAKVCSNSGCVVVRIVDCNCGPSANLIDLYAAAFVQLVPGETPAEGERDRRLDKGRVDVKLWWFR